MGDDERPGPEGSVPWRIRRKVGLPVRWWRVERRRRAQPPDGPALYVYGHSFAAGHGIEPWPEVVARALGLPLVNLGKAGDLLHQTVRLAKPHASRPNNDDVVLVEAGLNDVRCHGADPRWRAACERRVDRIRTRLAAYGATVHVLADPPLLDWTSPGTGAGRGSDEAWAEYHAALMARPGTIDLTPGWDRRTMISPDRVHPNEAGVAALAAAVLAGLRAQRGTGSGSSS
jgi:lysophospholipase L1-like esterase